MTKTQKRSRHRKSAKSCKGSSDARITSDPRASAFVFPKTEWTKYSGDFLKYIVRPKNGVGRPAAARLIQLEKIEWNRFDRAITGFLNPVNVRNICIQNLKDAGVWHS